MIRKNASKLRKYDDKGNLIVYNYNPVATMLKNAERNKPTVFRILLSKINLL